MTSGVQCSFRAVITQCRSIIHISVFAAVVKMGGAASLIRRDGHDTGAVRLRRKAPGRSETIRWPSSGDAANPPSMRRCATCVTVPWTFQ